jgi:hypothetical protein
MKRLVTLYLLCALIASPVFAQTSSTTVTIAPYEQDEFARWMKDLRRFEIVSLGSTPFVTFGTFLGYGAYRYFSGGMETFPIPFSSGKEAGFSETEQRNIFLISIGIGALIGLIDFAIVQIKRAQENRIASSGGAGSVITVKPLQADSVQDVPYADEFLKQQTIIPKEDRPRPGPPSLETE